MVRQVRVPVNGLVLDKMIKEFGFTKGAEIGVRRGELTASLVQDNEDLHMIACDIWGSHPSLNENHPHDSNKSTFLHYIRGCNDRVNVLHMLSTEGAEEIEDKSLDFIFIDATHTYDAVFKDIKAWLPKIKDDGFICGHDYCEAFIGVKNAVDEYIGIDKVFTEKDHPKVASEIMELLKDNINTIKVADSGTGCWYARKKDINYVEKSNS